MTEVEPATTASRRIGVLGAGSWGTALAAHFADSGLETLLWARRPEFAAEIDSARENARYLPEVGFSDRLRVGSDLAELGECDVVLVVVPSHGFREAVRSYLAATASVGGPEILVSATKGVEIETTARMSEVTAEEAEAAGREVHFAVLSGPTFAAELARRAPTAAVVASEEHRLAERLRERLATPSFRLYSTADVVGVELGGAAKNVIAVASGVVTGLGLGSNTVAALITRGLHEMTRLGIACGGDARTFSGLAGLGDLVLTCTGGLSRNRRTGMELAKGKTLERIQAETSMVAEGIKNSRSLSRLAERHDIEIPITREMMRVLYEGKSPRQALEELMARERKAEPEH